MKGLQRQELIGAALAAGAMLLVGGSVAASSLVADYPVLGGQGVRYLAAALLLAAWARIRRRPLLRPDLHEWGWLVGLAVVALAGLSVVLVEASKVMDPAILGVIIGAAPLAIVALGGLAARVRPTRRLLLAAAIVTGGTAIAQAGGASGSSGGWGGLLLCVVALAGVVASTLFAAPIVPRLGAVAVTTYACALAGVILLVGATVVGWSSGTPILRRPTAVELGAMVYLAVAVTAVVFLAWYGAMARLGTQRTGLFNGLIPVTTLLAVALAGTGEVTPMRAAGAVAVLVGVVLGLTGAPRGAGERAETRAPAPQRRDLTSKVSVASAHAAIATRRAVAASGSQTRRVCRS